MGGGTYGGSPPEDKMHAIEAFQQGRGRPATTTWLPHIVVGTALLCLGVYHMHLFFCYWPLYIPVVCSDNSAALKEFAATTDAISLFVELSSFCDNKNGYEATVIASGRGLAYVGASGPLSLQAGLVAAEGSVLPPSSVSSGVTTWTAVHGVARLSLGGKEAAELLPHFLEDPQVPLSWEWQLALNVKLPFGLFATWSEDVVAWQACRANFVSAVAQRQAERESQSPAMWGTRAGGNEGRNRLEFIGCRDSWESWKLSPQAPPSTERGMVAEMSADKRLHGELLRGFTLVAPALLCFALAAVVFSRLYKVVKGLWLAASAARLLVRADMDSPTARGEFETGLMGDEDSMAED